VPAHSRARRLSPADWFSAFGELIEMTMKNPLLVGLSGSSPPSIAGFFRLFGDSNREAHFPVVPHALTLASFRQWNAVHLYKIRDPIEVFLRMMAKIENNSNLTSIHTTLSCVKPNH